MSGFPAKWVLTEWPAWCLGSLFRLTPNSVRAKKLCDYVVINPFRYRFERIWGFTELCKATWHGCRAHFVRTCWEFFLQERTWSEMLSAYLFRKEIFNTLKYVKHTKVHLLKTTKQRCNLWPWQWQYVRCQTELPSGSAQSCDSGPAAWPYHDGMSFMSHDFVNFHVKICEILWPCFWLITLTYFENVSTSHVLYSRVQHTHTNTSDASFCILINTYLIHTHTRVQVNTCTFPFFPRSFIWISFHPGLAVPALFAT